MQIMMNLRLPASVKKEGKWYVACCPILDVFSQGETKEKALKNLTEALHLFFISCIERETLDEVLRKSGFTLLKKIQAGKKPFPKGLESIDVSLPFKAGLRDPSLCHA